MASQPINTNNAISPITPGQIHATSNYINLQNFLQSLPKQKQFSLADMHQSNPDLPNPAQPETLEPALHKLSKENNVEFTWETVEPDKTLNFIWIGTPLTERTTEREKLKAWRQQVPTLTMTVFVDAEQAKNTAVREFCKIQQIFLVNLEAIEKHLPPSLQAGMTFAWRQLGPNYGMLSDILRYPIVYYFGSYADIGDVHPNSTEMIFPRFFGKKTDIPHNTLRIGSNANDCLNVAHLGVQALEGICTQIESNLKNMNNPLYKDKPQKFPYGLFKRITRHITGPWMIHSIQKPEIQSIQRLYTCNLSWVSKNSKRTYITTWAQNGFQNVPDMNNRLIDYICNSICLNQKINTRIYDFFLDQLKNLTPKVRQRMKQECMEQIESHIQFANKTTLLRIDVSDPNDYSTLVTLCKDYRIGFNFPYAITKATKHHDSNMSSFLLSEQKREKELEQKQQRLENEHFINEMYQNHGSEFALSLKNLGETGDEYPLSIADRPFSDPIETTPIYIGPSLDSVT